MSAAPALSVVMPVYNEGASVAQTIREWTTQFDALGSPYEFLVYDDGSRDDTAAVLAQVATCHPALVVRGHANRGHGPTILRGYREARGDWIFQTDSDGEMPPEHFPALWTQRGDYDFLLGVRHDRHAPATRQLVTAMSKLVVRAAFGRGVTDVNTPYRLMRGSCLRAMLTRLPDDLFAPNVIISGLAARRRHRICEIPVPNRARRHGKSSLGSLNILGPAARCFRQSLAVALRDRRETQR